MERIVPERMICDGRTVAVVGCKTHPAGTHDHSPIRNDLTAVEVFTVAGSRWFGTERAWIGSDLRMHVEVDPRDEVRAAWPAS